ncbi:sirohydrochlorin chelatase [Zhaonella formicivorans]|jgi:sirohydrochlorin ferrochelatase|uniref:sirohydrochlorin chelatase n=1 Tax=Zhaonella formicivorans TaxID=2528593 RepID=UPI0010E857FA|nr:CbiX/SirB N-terminal domain-containing protein [Zhaonella formicivorans]
MALGVVILGHGSRLQEANQGLDAIVEMIKVKMANTFVEKAFMSQAEPTLADAIAKLSRQNTERIVVMPLFLFPGMHVQQDIPEILAEEKEKYAGKIEIVLAQNLGSDPRIAEIAIDRIREVS